MSRPRADLLDLEAAEGLCATHSGRVGPPELGKKGDVADADRSRSVGAEELGQGNDIAGIGELERLNQAGSRVGGTCQCANLTVAAEPLSIA